MSFTREQLSKSPALREIFDQTEAKGKVEGRAEARAEERAAAILRILDHRGVALSDADRQRISTCTDLGLLDRWFDAVLKAALA